MLDCARRGMTLMGGTKAMRAAGQEYLPKFKAESATDYAVRLKMSWLFNGYRKTVRDNTGRVFEKPVEIVDPTPTVAEWAENIDLQGNDLSMFARHAFQDALAGAGIGFIMVDAPRRDDVVTQAQAAAQNMRPYFVYLPLSAILGWRSEVINNVTTLTQIRILESITVEQDRFTDEAVEQIRVLERGESSVLVSLFRKDGRGRWVPFGDDFTIDVSEIPVVPIYLNRVGFFECEPLLDDLADVNIAHWQSQSDQRTILHAARVPVLFGTGIDPEQNSIVISASTATLTSETDANLQWVEHSGQAIGAGRQDLKDLEFQMEAHGMQLLVTRNGAQSATGEALDSKKETSTLAMTADAIKDALESAFAFAMEFDGSTETVTVEVNTDFGVSMMGAQEFTAMLSAVNTGNMSRETFLNEMRRRGMVSPDLVVADEIDRIESEGGDVMGSNGNE